MLPRFFADGIPQGFFSRYFDVFQPVIIFVLTQHFRKDRAAVLRIADPVPLEWAFAHGCDRVALILTKPIGQVSSDARDKHLAHLLQSHYPAAAEGLRRRVWRYSTAVQRARELERQGLVCIIAPDSTEGMSTLTKNRAGLEKMYAKGKQDAEALVRWMQNTKQDESVGT